MLFKIYIYFGGPTDGVWRRAPGDIKNVYKCNVANRKNEWARCVVNVPGQNLSLKSFMVHCSIHVLNWISLPKSYL